MSDESQKEVDLKRVRYHVDQLAEHFDTVHIFTTRHEQGELGGTVNVHLGSGDWFTRYGHIRHWVIQEEEVARIQARKNNE